MVSIIVNYCKSYYIVYTYIYLLYIHIHIHIECTYILRITINITKDYCHRIITVVVSRHYYRCNKFYCLIALFVCRGKRVQLSKPRTQELKYSQPNDTIFLSTMFQCTKPDRAEKIPFPEKILRRKRDQGQSVPVRSDFSSNSRLFLVYEPMLFSNCPANVGQPRPTSVSLGQFRTISAMRQARARPKVLSFYYYANRLPLILRPRFFSQAKTKQSEQQWCISEYDLSPKLPSIADKGKETKEALCNPLKIKMKKKKKKNSIQ